MYLNIMLNLQVLCFRKFVEYDSSYQHHILGGSCHVPAAIRQLSLGECRKVLLQCHRGAAEFVLDSSIFDFVSFSHKLAEFLLTVTTTW